MQSNVIELQGTIQPDGTLVPDGKLPLPAGRVRLTVEPLPREERPDPERFWTLMRNIWDGLRAAGHQPRTREEIDAEINTLRDEVEEEMRAAERLHEECERARRQAAQDETAHGVS